MRIIRSSERLILNTSSSFTGLWYLLFLKCRMLYCMLYIKLQSAFIPFTLLSLSCAVFIFHKRQCKYTDVFHCASVPSEPRTPCLISNSQNQWTFSIKLKWTALVFTKQHLSLQTHAHTHMTKAMLIHNGYTMWTFLRRTVRNMAARNKVDCVLMRHEAEGILFHEIVEMLHVTETRKENSYTNENTHTPRCEL